jgi:hypothetical protein
MAVFMAMSHSCTAQSVASKRSSSPPPMYQGMVMALRSLYGSVHLLLKTSQREPGPAASHSSEVPL